MAAVLLALASLTGCGPMLSLHPLYTDSDQALDAALVGTWTDDEGKILLRVKPSDKAGYDVVYLDESSNKENLGVRLVKLGAFQFVDITPPTESGLTVPGHLLGKIWPVDGSLHLAILGTDWLKERIANDPSAPAHEETSDGQLLLTAPTADVRKFVLRYAKEAQAWDETVLQRVAPRK